MPWRNASGLYLRWRMSSREFDSMLDDLVRQALYPFSEAEPPARVWRRAWRAVCAVRAGSALTSSLAPAGLPSPASLLAAFARWMRGLVLAHGGTVTYVPMFSNRSYYVDSSGRGLPSPFWDIALKQMFDMRLAF